MAYAGVLDDIRACVARQRPQRIPIFATSEEFDVKWYGRYTYNEVAADADKLVEVWSAAIREFDYDWAWLQIDDCFEFEPLGVGCVGEGNILRATCGYLPARKDTLQSLKMPDPQRSGRMPVKLEAIRRLKAEFKDTVCIVGSNAAPYSSSGLLYGLDTTMLLMYDDPDLLRATLEFFVELQSRWGTAQIKAGADAIWLGDCNAFSSMLSVQQYRDFALEPCRRVVESYRRAGGMTFLHNSEISLPHIAAECELGVSAISIGPAADLAAVKKATEGKNCILGNLDPIKVLMNGTPPVIEREVERIMQIGKSGPGYLFNLGEMTPRDVPAANMKAMMKRAKTLAPF